MVFNYDSTHVAILLKKKVEKACFHLLARKKIKCFTLHHLYVSCLFHTLQYVLYGPQAYACGAKVLATLLVTLLL